MQGLSSTRGGVVLEYDEECEDDKTPQTQPDTALQRKRRGKVRLSTSVRTFTFERLTEVGDDGPAPAALRRSETSRTRRSAVVTVVGSRRWTTLDRGGRELIEALIKTSAA